MAELATVAELLQLYGGWGMCAVLIAGITYVYKSMGALLEKRNDQFIQVLNEVGSLLQTVNDSTDRSEKLMDKIDRHLVAGEKIMERVETKLNSGD
jgi:hypothetical protein